MTTTERRLKSFYKKKNPIAILCGVFAFACLLPMVTQARPPLRRTPGQIDINNPPLPRAGVYTEHLDQKLLFDLVSNFQERRATLLAIGRGDSGFENIFAADQNFGVGANIGTGARFSRLPRADLNGPGQWASHIPARATGPNGQSCVECHTLTMPDGAGFISHNVIRDPLHSGDPTQYIQRSAPHVFGLGAVQLLAEEMTAELQATLTLAKNEACVSNNTLSVTKSLSAKGVSFGSVTVRQTLGNPSPRCNVLTNDVSGVDSDLVVKPLQRKGITATIRDFVRGAEHNELGIQPVEMVGEGVDGDGDGATNEFSVGDVTALTMYLASQPRATTKLELAAMGFIPLLTSGELLSIERGRATFDRVGCAVCHVPELKLNSAVFSEPSQSPWYRDAAFPAGQNPVAMFVDPAHPLLLDLARDVDGGLTPFQNDSQGRVRVELFSDLKRHDLGAEDSESIDEAGTGRGTWLTRSLWGMGSTPPYMHDGRATDLDQAIQVHGGEAAGSRALFNALSSGEKQDVSAYLLNLRLFKP